MVTCKLGKHVQLRANSAWRMDHIQVQKWNRNQSQQHA